MDKSFEQKLNGILDASQIFCKEELSKHTTFRIGGPADYFVEPQIHQVKDVVSLCKEASIPFYVIGNGSNILARDNGFRGVIIHIGKQLEKMECKEQSEGCFVTVEAGILLSKFSKTVAEKGLCGMEFAAGIPGTLGGAVAMNAGAYGGEIKDHIVSATVLMPDGEIKELSKEELQLGYRTSIIQKEAYIVLKADFELSYGDKEEINAMMADFQFRRKDKQPLEYPSAGSTFKRPEGYFAGKLIEDSGLKGYRVGDMMVSEKHCGFVVNVGKGTAKDAHQLMEDVERIVYEKFQVKLEPEVRFLGE